MSTYSPMRLPPTPIGKQRSASTSRSPAMLDALARDGDEQIIRAVVRNPATGHDTLAWLVTHDSAEVRHLAARHPSFPLPWIDKVLKGPDAGLRRAVLGRRDLTEAHFAVLVADPDVEVRSAMAGTSSVPQFWWRQLMVNCEDQVAVGLLRRRDLMVADMARLMPSQTSSVHYFRMFLTHPLAASAVTDEVVDWSIRSGDPTLGRLVGALRRPLSECFLLALVAGGSEVVMSALAHRKNLPESVLLVLATDGSVTLQRALATRDNLTPAVMDVLLRRTAERGLLVSSLWHRQQHARGWLVEHADVQVRRYVAGVVARTGRSRLVPRDRATYESALAALASDPHASVRTALARCCTEPAVLEVLAGDGAAAVRRAAVSNEHSPPVLLQSALSDRAESVRAASQDRFLSALVS